VSIDTISPQDEIVLALVRGHAPRVLTNLHPRDPQLQEIRAEAESHMPGYVMRSEYGIFNGSRGVMLSMFPDEITVQDAAYDGFERSSVMNRYAGGRYPGDASS
jgi:hypothetical protein